MKGKAPRRPTMNDPNSIPDLVAAALAERGMPADLLFRTLLIQDGYFVGEKFQFEGGCAIWIASSNEVEIYVDDGSSVKRVDAKTAA